MFVLAFGLGEATVVPLLMPAASQFMDGWMSVLHRYLFNVFSYLNVFYFVLSPCPAPTHMWPVCVIADTRTWGQPAVLLPA